MAISHKLGMVLGAAALAGAASAGSLAPAAQAAVSSQTGVVQAGSAPVLTAAATATPAAAKPSCVNVRHTVGTATQTVYVTNNCSYTVSFVVHRVGPDSPCLHAGPHGGSRSYKWANGLNYQGISFGCD
ncbi:hypothetical protein [Amycolatopsis pithecellobii]|uniref:Uncharacterized protein n=1 Tax=Amycolatopsis pithecellobii TaxID=664692 RepID=A0A6N7YR07_9PSEU|nr:hypothetical protein [Amycolatopsis pithecellobii]MTD54318.1 hypothetical protein [Amycolatopsis pithecellobii]